MIPRLDAAKLITGDATSLQMLAQAAEEVGFFTVYNTAITEAEVRAVIEAYRGFFKLPANIKQNVDMARTGANRGWGAPGSEQVDPDANPDYKQFFDTGRELPADDPMRTQNLSVYAPNLWPDHQPHFKRAVMGYFSRAMDVSMSLLRAIAQATGQDANFFDDKFDRPMALLRGNYYPERPEWAGDKDFGIATHTDYGCLTFLATDGTPGLEVRKRGGGWIPVSAPPGEFIINFGEMIEMWTRKKVVATPHRVVGGTAERISVPLFFNPNFNTNVAPIGSGEVIPAGEHLARRFNETYVHLQKD